MSYGTLTVTADGWRIELDLSRQVLAVSAPGETTWTSREEPLHPTLATVPAGAFVSAAALAQKAKLFDDGLYAAVEIAAQEGAGRHPGKAQMLRAACRTALTLSDAAEIQAILVAAARLGGLDAPAAPAEVETVLERILEDFHAAPFRSKPIGFYTWSDALRRIFQQDRMLQTMLKGEDQAAALLAAMQRDAPLVAAYQAHHRLFARLTNPLVETPLMRRFFPPSVSHETELVKRLFTGKPIPDGFVLVDEMIRRIQAGTLDLTPHGDSGWYDHQTWALEPLVVPDRMPEAPRLRLDHGYRKHLLELFKGILTLTRETHIKQLEIPLTGSGLGMPLTRGLEIAPELPAEPVPTFYLRRALAYGFLRGVLEDAFGPHELSTMHRLTADGPVSAPLADELNHIQALFAGAHAAVHQHLGTPPDPAASDGLGAAVQHFERFASAQGTDPDLGRDVRCMVPVFFDIGRELTKVWIFMGWTDRHITIHYATPPAATFLDRKGRPVSKHPDIRWATQFARVATPVSAEIYVARVLDRDEFRRLCDEAQTESEILRRLGVERPRPARYVRPELPGHRRDDFR